MCLYLLVYFFLHVGIYVYLCPCIGIIPFTFACLRLDADICLHAFLCVSLFECVCVCACMCAYTLGYVPVCAYVFTYLCIYLHKGTCMDIYTNIKGGRVCVCARVCVGLFVRMCLRMYVWMCTSMREDESMYMYVFFVLYIYV